MLLQLKKNLLRLFVLPSTVWKEALQFNEPLDAVTRLASIFVSKHPLPGINYNHCGITTNVCPLQRKHARAAAISVFLGFRTPDCGLAYLCPANCQQKPRRFLLPNSSIQKKHPRDSNNE